MKNNFATTYLNAIRHSPWISAGLACILILYLTLSFAGIRYGLPDRDHILSYNCDETIWIEGLHFMRDGKFFNPQPHIHQPTLYLSAFGVGVAAASVAGLIPISQSKEFFRTNPHLFARLYMVGRVMQVLFGILFLLLLFWVAKKYFGPETGILAAALLCFTPSLIAASHFSQASIPVSVLSLIAMAFWFKYGETQFSEPKWFFWGSVFTGLAISTKYSALSLAGPFLYISFLNLKRWKTMSIGGLFVIGGFIIGFPWLVVSPTTFFKAFAYHAPAQQLPIHNFFESLVFSIRYSLSFAMGPVLLGTGLIAVLLSLFRGKNFQEKLMIAWLVVMYIATIRVGYIASSARLLIIVPVLILFAARLLSRLMIGSRTQKSLAALLLIGIFLTAGFQTMALINVRRSPPLQKVATEWIKNNIPRDKTIGIPYKIYWWTPDIIYQSAHHPERHEDTYDVTSFNYSTEMAKEIKPDYIVASVQEKRGDEEVFKFFDWLESGQDYELIKSFPRKVQFLNLEWKRPEGARFQDDDIWASTLHIYRKKD